MARFPESSNAGDSNEYPHSIEQWGAMGVGDFPVSPEYAVELRRRFEQANPGQHMDGQQFRDWLRVTFEGDPLIHLEPDDEEELARQYEQEHPGADAETPLPEDAAPRHHSEAPPPTGPGDLPLA